MKANTTMLYPNEKAAIRVTEYAEAQSGKLPEALRQYHDWILTQEKANMTISKFQAQALMWIARAANVKRVLEIGVFRGFSAMTWSFAVGAHGSVTGLELSQEYADIARKGFEENGISNCEVIVGDALGTLAALAPAEPYDLIFIDAQKTGYPQYLRAILEQSQPGSERRLLRKGGLIVADNALRWGLVADPSMANKSDEQLKAIRASSFWTDKDAAACDEFNRMMNDSPRIDAWLMPLFDGVGLGRLVD